VILEGDGGRAMHHRGRYAALDFVPDESQFLADEFLPATPLTQDVRESIGTVARRARGYFSCFFHNFKSGPRYTSQLQEYTTLDRYDSEANPASAGYLRDSNTPTTLGTGIGDRRVMLCFAKRRSSRNGRCRP